MSRNITWCFLRKLTEKLYLSTVRTPPTRALTLNYAIQNVGYDHSHDCDYHEVKTYKQFSDHYKVGLGRSIIALQKILDISKENSIIAANECTAFNHLSMATLLDNVALLHDVNVEISTLKLNTYALADTTKNIKRKIEYIKMIDKDVNSVIELFRLPVSELSALATTTIYDRKYVRTHRNRLQYLSDILKVKLSDMCIRCVRHRYLLTLDIAKLVYVSEFLLGAGMLPSNIIQDLSIYRYSIERIKKRIIESKTAGIDPLKGWIVKCPRDKIIKVAKKIKKVREIEKCSGSIENHFAKILNTDVEVVKLLMLRMSCMRTGDIDKRSQKLKILRNAGYTATDIYRCRMVLQYKPDTLRERLGKWKYYGLGELHLCKMSMSSHNFDRMVQNEVNTKMGSEYDITKHKRNNKWI